MSDTVCPKCWGSGAIELERTHMGIPITQPCPCTLAKDMIMNLNRGWPGLSKSSKIESTPLMDYVNECLYITAFDEVLRVHLRHAAIRMGWTWNFKVITDSDLMTAWLSPVSLIGKEILDPDAAAVSSAKATLVDLVEPPDLLIIRLGVKNARNVAMPEVFLETLFHRRHLERPVWVVDQPIRRLDANHLCYSDEAVRTLSSWKHLDLMDVTKESGLEIIIPSPPNRVQTTMSLAGDQPTMATKRFEVPTYQNKKSKWKGQAGDR